LQMNLHTEEVNQLFVNVKLAKHRIVTHLFNSHFRSLYYYAYRLTCNKQQSEDIVNDIYQLLKLSKYII
jgi:DNA-directed RNA polymerase specialized sigma24 family protein